MPSIWTVSSHDIMPWLFYLLMYLLPRYNSHSLSLENVFISSLSWSSPPPMARPSLLMVAQYPLFISSTRSTSSVCQQAPNSKRRESCPSHKPPVHPRAYLIQPTAIRSPRTPSPSTPSYPVSQPASSLRERLPPRSLPCHDNIPRP